MEQQSTSNIRVITSSIRDVTSRIVKPQNFCFCMRLTNVVILVSVLAFVFGIGFVLLGTEISSDETINQAIAVGCHISGFIFLFWFLTQLLLQTLSIKFPRKCSIIIGYILSAWLLLMFVIFIILFNIRREHDEYCLFIICATVSSALGIVFALYSVWLLKHYAKSLEDASPRQSNTRQSEESTSDQENHFGMNVFNIFHSSHVSSPLPHHSSATSDITQARGSPAKLNRLKEVFTRRSDVHRSETFVLSVNDSNSKHDDPVVPSRVSRSQQTSTATSTQSLDSQATVKSQQNIS